jgi:hypothetical protein
MKIHLNVINIKKEINVHNVVDIFPFLEILKIKGQNLIDHQIFDFLIFIYFSMLHKNINMSHIFILLIM